MTKAIVNRAYHPTPETAPLFLMPSANFGLFFALWPLRSELSEELWRQRKSCQTIKQTNMCWWLRITSATRPSLALSWKCFDATLRKRPDPQTKRYIVWASPLYFIHPYVRTLCQLVRSMLTVPAWKSSRSFLPIASASLSVVCGAV